VIRERAQIGRSGVAVVSLVLDRRGAVMAPPRVISRGVIDETEGAGEVLRAASIGVARALADCDARTRSSDEGLTETARLAARRVIEAKSGRRPLVLVSLLRV
jgi:ribonuclease J